MQFGAPTSLMSTRLLLALVGALLIVRLPSLAQPMGPDQGLYAYVGDRILHGELAYRDAWDQKPPGIHYVYAALRAVSSRDVVVPAADLVAAALVAALLWIIGTKLGGPVAGGVSAAVFLLLSDPSFARYGGVRVRAQAETFIALAVTGALALVLTLAQGAKGAKGGVRLVAAGLLLGATFALKYNAGLYVVVVLLALAVTSGVTLLDVVWIAVGSLVIPLALFVVFWRGGALHALYQATIAYNLQYSGETYASRWDMARYLVTFPIQHARVDALWFVGGLGCVVLLVAGLRRRVMWLPVAWVGVACVSIAINGSRNLPQYFLQAAPALALAAGLAGTMALTPLPKAARWVIVLVIAVFVWRAGDDPFPKLAGNVWHDTRYLTGRIDRRAHLAKYGGTRDIDKYSALDNMDIGGFLAARTTPDETVYVFGYSPGSYVYANRRSASRFFWSRPVILDFNREDPRYGVAGLRTDLERSRPAYVVLQHHDWSPDVQDSAPFFMSQPALADWLRAGYHNVPFIDGFDGWERNGR
jgi:4-amino-4-deoxy-L-arabinose transferase-like glycosyltransferase